MQPTSYKTAGAWILLAASALGLLAALADYFVPGNGIDHTEGALLVVISTLLALVSGVVVFQLGRGPRLLRDILGWLLALDFICTAFAAYMLESNALAILMIIGFIGWLIAEFAPGPVVYRKPRKAVRA